MITRADLDERVREWSLNDHIVEKDYVIGWLLWGIGSNPHLCDQWVFKGGTCLKKCYFETYRFSEDLDFTVLPGGPHAPEHVLPLLGSVLASVADETGIDFRRRDPTFRLRPDGRSAEGTIYYAGPRGAPGVASIKIDLSASELVVRPTVLREIGHSYPDPLPLPATVRCYAFDELFAEKLRAMGERGRPRDLYDIVHLFRRRDLTPHAKLVRETLVAKCEHKGVPVPTAETIVAIERIAELRADWLNMLAHQLPALPNIESFLEEIPHLFGWLDGRLAPEEFKHIQPDPNEDATWRPPTLVWTWGEGVPLETIRFAAANHLCVDIGYQQKTRRIEPYSLRRTREGHLLLHAIKAESGEHRSYRVDKITNVTVSTETFRPRYPIEFVPSGPLSTPPTPRVARPMRAHGDGPTYIVRCPLCSRAFRHKTSRSSLAPHKSESGWECHGRTGYVDNVEY